MTADLILFSLFKEGIVDWKMNVLYKHENAFFEYVFTIMYQVRFLNGYVNHM